MPPATSTTAQSSLGSISQETQHEIQAETEATAHTPAHNEMEQQEGNAEAHSRLGEGGDPTMAATTTSNGASSVKRSLPATRSTPCNNSGPNDEDDTSTTREETSDEEDQQQVPKESSPVPSSVPNPGTPIPCIDPMLFSEPGAYAESGPGRRPSSSSVPTNSGTPTIATASSHAASMSTGTGASGHLQGLQATGSAAQLPTAGCFREGTVRTRDPLRAQLDAYDARVQRKLASASATTPANANTAQDDTSPRVLAQVRVGAYQASNNHNHLVPIPPGSHPANGGKEVIRAQLDQYDANVHRKLDLSRLNNPPPEQIVVAAAAAAADSSDNELGSIHHPGVKQAMEAQLEEYHSSLHRKLEMSRFTTSDHQQQQPQPSRKQDDDEQDVSPGAYPGTSAVPQFHKHAHPSASYAVGSNMEVAAMNMTSTMPISNVARLPGTTQEGEDQGQLQYEDHGIEQAAILGAQLRASAGSASAYSFDSSPHHNRGAHERSSTGSVSVVSVNSSHHHRQDEEEGRPSSLRQTSTSMLVEAELVVEMEEQEEQNPTILVTAKEVINWNSGRVLALSILAVLLLIGVVILVTLVAGQRSDDDSQSPQDLQDKQDSIDAVWRSKFQYDSQKFLEGFGARLDLTMRAADTFMFQVVSYARSTDSEWPYITLPDLPVQSAKLLSQTKSIYMTFYPLITAEARAAWENFTKANDFWVEDSLEVQSRNPNFHGPIVTDYNVSHSIWNNEGPVDPESPGPFSPSWMGSPVIPYYYPYNWNALAYPKFSDPLMAAMESKSVVFGSVANHYDPDDPIGKAHSAVTNDWAVPFLVEGDDPSEPFSDMYYPVIDGGIDDVMIDLVGDNTTEALGSVAFSFYWRDVMKSIMSDWGRGLVIVFSDPCGGGRYFTYYLDGSNVPVFLGYNDYHDEKYNYMAVSSKLTDLLISNSDNGLVYTGLPANSEYCPYSLTIYPSDVYANADN